MTDSARFQAGNGSRIPSSGRRDEAFSNIFGSAPPGRIATAPPKGNGTATIASPESSGSGQFSPSTNAEFFFEEGEHRTPPLGQSTRQNPGYWSSPGRRPVGSSGNGGISQPRPALNVNIEQQQAQAQAHQQQSPYQQLPYKQVPPHQQQLPHPQAPSQAQAQHLQYHGSPRLNGARSDYMNHDLPTKLNHSESPNISPLMAQSPESFSKPAPKETPIPNMRSASSPQAPSIAGPMGHQAPDHYPHHQQYQRPGNPYGSGPPVRQATGPAFSDGPASQSLPRRAPVPQANGPRSMSLTTPSAYNRPMIAGYDRDPYANKNNRGTTMSGRVIPQRQNTMDAIHQMNNGRSVSLGNAPLNSAPTSTVVASGGKLSSTKSSSSLLNLRRGDTKSSVKSQNSIGEERSLSHSGTVLTASSRKVPLVYPALLSKVAELFFQMMVRGDRAKNELTYKNAFTGHEAVDLISYIIKTPDRNLALLLGRALDAQKLFHDVTYDHRLRDTPNEVYQFNEVVIEQEEAYRRGSSSSFSTAGSRQVSNGSVVTATPLDAVSELGEGRSAVVVNVNGIFTLLAECYSPTCTRDRLCYSISCPRRLEQQARLNMKPQPGLKRTESRLSLHGDDEKEQKLWIHTVSKEIADSVDDQEKKRQEIICEVIYTERDFVKALEYLRDFWIKPLSTMDIIPEFRRKRVVQSIFSNVMEVHSVNIKLAEALTKRQQSAPVVQQIGDIFLEYVHKFEPFVKYGASQSFGKYELENEKSINPAFVEFVDETERKKESRKLELNGYLTKPTTRLARYPLLLEAVLKRTSEDNPDYKNLTECIKIIREFLTKVNAESGKAENRLTLDQLSKSLLLTPEERRNLMLSSEERNIIFKGNLKRKTTDKDNQGDIQLYLFDNALLFLKRKLVNKREQLKVHRKPIPLELLVISESEEIAPRSLTKLGSTSLMSKTPSKVDLVGSKFPITFQHLGRRGYEITLYSSTFIGRKKWVEHMQQQKKILWEAADVYTERTVQEKYFSSGNRINCIAPFYGGRKFLFGTDNGIYMCDVKYDKNNGGAPITSTPVKVISIPNITQLDVLDNKYMTLLALSDKTLYSWPLECVDTPDPVGNNRKGKKVTGGHINFYKAGTCLGRFLVCTVKSSSMSSVIKVLEPFDPQPRGKGQRPLRRFLGAQNEGLKVFKEFYIASEVLSISFLRRRLCVGCAKGFEIVDLDTLETQSLLDPADTSLDFATRKESLRPSSIYRLQNDFLLNYSDFSFFVNSHGWKSQTHWMVNWEGIPQHFALAYPYLLGFDSSMIEVRHMDTGKLVRVILGENIRFLHEGTREILFVREDDQGFDQVMLLDFWEKMPKLSEVPGDQYSMSTTSTSTSTVALSASTSNARLATVEEFSSSRASTTSTANTVVSGLNGNAPVVGQTAVTRRPME